MSDRLIRTTRLKHRGAALIAFVALSGFTCGLLAVADGPAFAQPTVQPKEKGADDPNKGDPLPADGHKHKAREGLQIRDKERAIFGDIEDFKPIARRDVNRGEHDAWIEFLQHAKTQKTSDLNEYALRELVPLDFKYMARGAYRTELVRFDGKLVCVRRLVVPQELRDSNVTELYEARLTPIDESTTTPVSLVFFDLPDALAGLKEKKENEWIDADQWVTASGYFFKTTNVPGEQANLVVALPVFVGRGLTMLPGPPSAIALDKNVRVYKFIKDKAKMIQVVNEGSWAEIAAYHRVLAHAARFSAEELEQHAQADLKFADLFEESRRDYKLSCIKFEGRLIALRRVKGNEWLTGAGVTELFEGWMIPANEPRGNPICIHFTEPLAGVEPESSEKPARLINKWVSFAGYSFKLLRYESAEQDAKTPSKNVEKLAPMLIGRSPIARRDPDTPTSVTWGVFINAAMICGALLILSAGAFTWYYRGGDRKAKAEMDAVRNRNPFDPNTNPPGA